MVAIIGSGTSIRRTFLYNEHKEKAGVAECILAANYPIDLAELDSRQRLNMLLKTASLHPDVKRPSIHISLNFAPGEQLSDNRLRQICQEYMEQIGFGEQPYLVYRHDDAAHPHVHITTIKIRPDGSRIDTQNIGKNLSEPARKMIEKKYGLVKAEQQSNQLFVLKPVNAGKVVYGQEPTRKAISGVLQSVLQGYRYTSLAELNAVLSQYNIMADRGSERSRIYRHQGLVYHVLDTDGKPVGVPVKASSFYNNPGLKFLEKQYLKNDVERQPHRLRVKNTIDLALLHDPKSGSEQLIQKLKLEGIHTVVRQNEQGFIYGLTFVDFRTKCVFNGSAIGKGYSAKSILDRLETTGRVTTETDIKPNRPALEINTKEDTSIQQINHPQGESSDPGLIADLMAYEYVDQRIPYWRKRKKRKKRK